MMFDKLAKAVIKAMADEIRKRHEEEEQSLSLLKRELFLLENEFCKGCNDSHVATPEQQKEVAAALKDLFREVENNE